MQFNEYQEKSAGTAMYLNAITAKHPDLPIDVLHIMGLSYASLGLGECGEVQGKVKKIIRDCGGEITEHAKQEIGKELGDVLWYIAATCRELGLNMDDVAQQNIDKLLSRQERGVLTGNGDNR